MEPADRFAQVVQAMVALRADQKRLFGRSLSAQAWDLLMIVYLARIQGRPIRDRDAVFIAGIDAEAGKRWIAHLIGAGVLKRCGETSASCITLTSDAAAKIEAFVDRAQIVPTAP